MQQNIKCWCGNNDLTAFSNEYLTCTSCYTLLSQVGLSPEKTLVKNDEEDFYGKNYWLSHQSGDLGYPDIFRRAKSDLSERCLHWLRILLKYKLPPAKTLEIGCAHGGFVGMLRQCGYDANGLEMSPWIAEFAHQSFAIPMLTGPIEQQNIPPASLDMLIMMDVMEHLPDPIKTMRHCLSLLKTDGVLVIQTPNYPIEKNHADMVSTNHPFLEQLKADEHLYLFSENSIQAFFKKIMNTPVYMQFEPAMFAQYDMFCMVSKQPIKLNSNEEIEKFLESSTSTRVLQAMLDLAMQRDDYIALYKQADIDRTERLKLIHSLTNTATGLIKYKLKSLGRMLRDKINF